MGGGLLRLLLAVALTLPDGLPVQQHTGGEYLGVVRTAGGDQFILQRLVAAPLHQLLQLRLVVPAALLYIRLPLLIQQDPVNERTGCLQSAVQIYGGKNGLRGVRQNGRPLPPPPASSPLPSFR